MLSIVIATTQPWPELQMTLDSLFDQALAHQAEVIVADATGYGLPEDVDQRYPGIVWLRPGVRSVFALRAAGMERAHGSIVATTEDHCQVGPTWCADILRAHGEHPNAGVVGGAVVNGFPRGLKNWAHHFLVFGPAVPPIDEDRPGPIWCAANIAYKRHVLDTREREKGIVEMFLARAFQAKGVKFVADASLCVEHYQTFPLATFCRYHFHNGRTIAATRRPDMTLFEWPIRVAGCAVLPLFLIGLRARHIWPKRMHRSNFVRCLPWLVPLTAAHAVGELAGYLTGPGSSPERLR